MKYIFVLLASLGIVVSALALREHYRTEATPPAASTNAGTAASSITAPTRLSKAPEFP